MRIGAIFARGSCRVLTCVLALGVVALSAGEAVAQETAVPTFTAIKVTPGTLEVDEGGSETFTVGLNGTAPAGATITVTVARTLAEANDNAEFRVDSDADLTAWEHIFSIPGVGGYRPTGHDAASGGHPDRTGRR